MEIRVNTPAWCFLKWEIDNISTLTPGLVLYNAGNRQHIYLTTPAWCFIMWETSSSWGNLSLAGQLVTAFPRDSKPLPSSLLEPLQIEIKIFLFFFFFFHFALFDSIFHLLLFEIIIFSSLHKLSSSPRFISRQGRQHVRTFFDQFHLGIYFIPM